MPRKLATTTEVIDALGGNQVVARITRRNAKAVSMWRSFNTFPPDTFLAMNAALSAKGKCAPSALWRMIPISPEK